MTAANPGSWIVPLEFSAILVWFVRMTEGLHDRSNMARDGSHFEG